MTPSIGKPSFIPGPREAITKSSGRDPFKMLPTVLISKILQPARFEDWSLSLEDILHMRCVNRFFRAFPDIYAGYDNLAIRRLFKKAVESDNHTGAVIPSHFQPKRLTDLRLICLSLQVSDFESVLKLCPHLTSLSIDRGGEEYLRLIATCTKLEKLDILLPPCDSTHMHIHPSDAELSYIAHLPLKNFALTYAPITGSGLGVLRRDMPLESLNLAGCRALLSHEMRSIPTAFLRHLDIRDCSQLNDEALQLLKDVQLEVLHLDELQNITNAGLTFLKDMPLKHITLSSCRQISNPGMANLPKKSLTQLDIDGCTKISDEGILVLVGAPLRVLNMANLPLITDAVAEHLAQMPLEKIMLFLCRKFGDSGLLRLKDRPIIDLDLRHTQVADEGLTHLPRTLRVLSIGEDVFLQRRATPPPPARITDEGMQRLAVLPTLEELTVESLGVTDAGLSHLAAMTLRVIRLECPNLTDRGVALLNRAKLRRLILSRCDEISETFRASLKAQGIYVYPCTLKVVPLSRQWDSV